MSKRLTNLALLIIMFISACSAQAATTPQKLRVYMDWFPNIEFAGIYAAQEKGWYREAGIDLELVFDGLDIIPNVLKGKVDIGMDSGHDLIRHAGKDTTIKAFAAQYQLNPNCIVVRKDLPVNSLADLKGRTLGVFAPQDLDMYRVMLGYNGLSLNDVKFKEIHTFKESELIELLKKHEVDGFIAWEFNWTVTFSLLAYPVRVFPGYENGFQFYGSVFFAKDEFLRSHRKLLGDFLGVTFRGWREVYQKPEHYARFVVEKKFPSNRYINGSKALTLRQQLAELKLRKRYFIEGVGEENMGRMSRASWEKSLEIARSSGLIPASSKLTVDDIYDAAIWSQPQTIAAKANAKVGVQ